MLITLGIIGIVATITIPVISANIQKNVLKNQFKKTYSNIQNTYNLISAEKGSEYACYYHYNRSETDNIYESADCKDFWNDFFSKFNIIDICKGECIPDYKSKEEVILNGGELGWGVCSFVDKKYIQNINGYILNDGSMLIFQNSYLLIIDVNGTKAPNKYGYMIW